MDSDQTIRGSDESAIDVATALDQLGGDRELLGEVVETFVDTIPDMVAAIEAALTDRDGAALMAAAHSIKGAAANIGAKPTQAAAESLESLGERNEMAEAESMLGNLQSRLAALRAAVANGLPE